MGCDVTIMRACGICALSSTVSILSIRDPSQAPPTFLGQSRADKIRSRPCLMFMVALGANENGWSYWDLA